VSGVVETYRIAIRLWPFAISCLSIAVGLF
jgi:hypothetical protein